MTDYVNRARALTVACPLCDAEAGEPCIGSRAQPRASVHHDRMDEAARTPAPNRNRPTCHVCTAPLDVEASCAMALYDECPHHRPVPLGSPRAVDATEPLETVTTADGRTAFAIPDRYRDIGRTETANLRRILDARRDHDGWHPAKGDNP